MFHVAQICVPLDESNINKSSLYLTIQSSVKRFQSIRCYIIRRPEYRLYD